MNSIHTFQVLIFHKKTHIISLKASNITPRARVLSLEKERVEDEHGESLKILEPLNRAHNPSTRV